MSAIFADSAALTQQRLPDEQIENSYVVLDNIDNKSELGIGIDLIVAKLADSDSVLSVPERQCAQ